MLFKGHVMESTAFEFAMELFGTVYAGVEVVFVNDTLAFVLEHTEQLVVHVAALQGRHEALAV